MTGAEAESLLAECRRKIDKIDSQLRDLLNQRFGEQGYEYVGNEAADLAVYHAKRGGRRTWQWYVPEVSTSPHE